MLGVGVGFDTKGAGTINVVAPGSTEGVEVSAPGLDKRWSDWVGLGWRGVQWGTVGWVSGLGWVYEQRTMCNVVARG